jgi:tRNA pseudouridine38-40 synthase
VHALNQSIDFLIPEFWQNLNQLKISINKIIAPYIYIKNIRLVDKNFHSRFLATARSYRYIITNQYTPFFNDYSFYKKELDTKIMQKAIQLFIGKHDFEYFHKLGSEPNSFIREIYNAYIIKHKNYVIIKYIGNGFLRSQVRMMTEFLIDISDKKLTVADLKRQIDKKEKVSTKLIIPNGLYFERVYYNLNKNIVRY